MNKYIKIINLALLSLAFFTTKAQIGLYHTLINSMQCYDPFLPYANNITIGVYPDMAVSYHEVTVSPGNVVGYVTINKNAVSAHRIELYPYGLLIRDMVQYEFTNRIYFCGTKGDTVGVFGYFDIDNTGSFVEIYYDEVPYSVRLSKMVEYKENGGYYLAAYGDGSAKINGEYIFVDVNLHNSISPLYFVSGLGHTYKPFGIVCTDNYISLYSHDLSKNNIYVRKFYRSNLYDPICNNLYEYPVGSNMAFGPLVTFLGEDVYNNGEDQVAIVYMTQEGTNWKTYLKRIELDSMDMVGNQWHPLRNKSGLFGLTYLAESKRLAVLEMFDPSYNYMCSSVVMMDPWASITYTAQVFRDNNIKDYNSIGRLYSAGYTVNHFVAGFTNNNNSYWWAQDDVVNPIVQCANTNTISVKVDQPTNKSILLSPLMPIGQAYNLKPSIQVPSSYYMNTPCPDPIR